MRLALPPSPLCGMILAGKGGEFMFLIKCNCGCFFTLKDNTCKPLVKCPDCETLLNIDFSNGSNCVVNHIPDNAKVSVKFDV